jgi:hypothetical protein
MWTQFFIYYCHERSLYTLYLTVRNERALAAHWQDKGEHFYQESKGPDHAIAQLQDVIPLTLPTQPARFGWDAQPVVGAAAA